MIAWVGALGWLVARERSPLPPAGMAEPLPRVNPRTVFYYVRLYGRQIGIASSAIDTVPAGVRATMRYDVRLPAGDSTRRVVRSDEVLLSRRLALESFAAVQSGGGVVQTVRGRVDDGALRWQTGRQRGATSSHGEIPAEEGLIVASALPLRLAFSAPLVRGRAEQVPLFEAGRGRVTRLQVRVAQDTVLAIPDSAVYDTARRSWTPAHVDSVRAWQIDARGDSTAETLWIDAEGQLVSGRTAEGWELSRSAFELVTADYHMRGGAPPAPSPTARRPSTPDPR